LDTSERKPVAPTRLDEQLTKYLTDAHSIEEQALVQMRSAPKLAGDPEIASAFERHLDETEDHEHWVRARLEARGADPSRFKDLAGKVTGKGFALFAKFQPDTTGKLVAHAYSYEHMELAAYDLLARVAEHAGDSETAAAAMRIGEQERGMAERLAGFFDRAVEVSLREKDADDLQEEVNKYLTDAHAIEIQAIQLLEKSSKLAGSSQLASAYEEHLEETRVHQRLITGRLEARGASPSRIKDAALGLGALNWAAFFASQPDTPAKLAGFSYAFEHLEIAAYELLSRAARRAGDTETEVTRQASWSRSARPQRWCMTYSQQRSTRRYASRMSPPTRKADPTASFGLRCLRLLAACVAVPCLVRRPRGSAPGRERRSQPVRRHRCAWRPRCTSPDAGRCSGTRNAPGSRCSSGHAIAVPAGRRRSRDPIGSVN
jgi:ferritin-like metal-binding protein YciE